MNDTKQHAYEAQFRNSPAATLGSLGILASGAGAAAAAFASLPASDVLWPGLGIAAACIVAIVFVSFAARSRRVWRAGDNGVIIEEMPRLGWLWRAVHAEAPYAEIRAFRRVESGFDVMLEIETASGARHHLMQGFQKNKAGVLLPDANGLHAFSNVLRQRIAAAGSPGVSFQDGLGFWNKPFGLGMQVLILALTLILSGLIIYWLVSGVHRPQGAAMQGLALVLLLPFGVAYSLYRSLARRSFVLGLRGLRDKITVKP